MINRRQFLGGLIAASVSPKILATGRCQIPVLMYHAIDSHGNNPYSVKPHEFEQHMEWLHDEGFVPISIHDIDDAKAWNFVITFDDGYKSFLDHAWPVLEKYKWQSTINIVSNWVGNTIPDIREYEALSWQDVKDLKDSNLVQFGCHTHNLHSPNRNANEVSPDEIVRDLSTFNMLFDYHTGSTTDIIAWPYGFYNDDAIAAAESVGFEYFLTSHSGLYSFNKYRIPRINIGQNTIMSDTIDQYISICR